MIAFLDHKSNGNRSNYLSNILDEQLDEQRRQEIKAQLIKAAETGGHYPHHCIKLTPRQVEIYLERLLKKLTEVYSIRKFTSKEELHPQCCPLPGCQEDS